MPENKGGLDYKIDVSGNFEAKLKQFEDSLASLEKKAGAVRVGKTGSAQPFATAKDVRNTGQIAKNIQGASEATARNSKLMRELQIRHEQVVDLSNRLGVSQNRAASLIGVSSAQAKQLKLNLFDAEQAARQFLFTFRRLVGILAIFTAARELASAIAAGVREMSDFNAELETARIGIAQIVVSVGEVRSQQGELLTGADAFAASLQKSNDILNQIKKDAIGSVATFESLVKAYQVAVGPGLAAGLNLDQIRELSKRLTEGAIALGVPLNQLSEEIRSLLKGTATARNTRIAALFGGAKEANEAVRRAKEEGNLYEVLSDRLQGVAQGASAAEQSLAVLRSNLQDTVQLLLAEGGLEQFDAVKESILGLTNALREQDAGGAIIFRPEVVGIVREVAGTLSSVVRSFRELTDTGQVFVLIRNALATIGDVLRFIAPLASAAFQGLITGANLALSPLRLLADALRELSELVGLDRFGLSLAQVVKYLVAGVAALKIWVVSFRAVSALVSGKLILGSLQKIAAILASIKVLQSGISAEAFIVTAITQGWAAAWALVNTQALLTAGLFGGILAVVGLILVKTGALEKAIGFFTRNTKKANKEAEKLGASFSGSSQSLEDIDASLKDIAKQIETIADETAIQRALSGVEESAREVLELSLQRNQQLDKATRLEQEQLTASKQRLDVLKQEISALDDFISKNAASDDPAAQRGILSAAEARLAKLQELSDEQGRFKAAQDAINARAVELNELYNARAVSIKAERNDVEAVNKESLRRLEAEEAVKVAKAGILSDSAKALATAKAESAILELQRDQLVRREEITRKNIEAARDLANASQEGLKATQKEIDELESSLEQELKASVQVSVDEARLRSRLSELEGLISNTFDTATKEGLRIELETVTDRLEVFDAQKEAAKQEAAATQNRLNVANRTLAIRRQAIEEDKALIALQEESSRKIALDQLELQAKQIEADEALRQARLESAEGFVNVVNAGLTLGIEQFQNDLDTAAVSFANAIDEGLTGVAESFGSTFREYLETGEDVSVFFLNALSGVFLNIAEQFATQVASSILSTVTGGILDRFLGVGQDTALIASNQTLVAALTANTAALGGETVATTANTASETANTAATTANTGGLFAGVTAWLSNTAATLANTAATIASTGTEALGNLIGGLSGILSQGLVVAAIAAQTAALLIPLAAIAASTAATAAFTFADLITPFPFAKGGRVPQPKGYASGGNIGGMPRPSNIPSSDTVPAWLTPGEFVIKRDMVRKYGANLMHSLNNGSFPSSIGASLRAQSARVQAFANGGPVTGGSFAQDSSSPRPVNVAFFDDRNALAKWTETTEGETAILNVMKKNSFLFS